MAQPGDLGGTLASHGDAAEIISLLSGNERCMPWPLLARRALPNWRLDLTGLSVTPRAGSLGKAMQSEVLAGS
jgi:hypothetical protein